MKRRFVRTLLVTALLQFFITRQRAGRTLEEGAAEMLWLRYPSAVLANALAWTLMLSLFGATLSFFRRAR
jgi:hypothetical protein